MGKTASHPVIDFILVIPNLYIPLTHPIKKALKHLVPILISNLPQYSVKHLRDYLTDRMLVEMKMDDHVG
jgi:hypothetical protein